MYKNITKQPMKFLIVMLLIVGIVMVTFIVFNNLNLRENQAAGKGGSDGKEKSTGSNKEKSSGGSKQGSGGSKSGSRY